MLVIARALMAQPRLMLLDEPSLGLAPLIARTIFEIIAGLTKGVTVLLVEQNAHAALKLASRAYVLEMGRIVLEGSDLLDDPRVRAPISAKWPWIRRGRQTGSDLPWRDGRIDAAGDFGD